MNPIEIKKPLVTIGLAVYNGEEYIKKSIESLLSQDFADFELIISDNCSTDSTPEICKLYAQADSRIIFNRNELNIGAIQNFNKLVRMGRGRYHMWAAHDDLWAPTFLSTCVAELERESLIGLACTDVVFVRDDGFLNVNWNLFREQQERVTIDEDGLSSRFFELIRHFCIYNKIYGLFRREALLEVLSDENCSGWDTLLYVRFLLRGNGVIEVNEPKFFYRLFERPVDFYKDSMKVTNAESKSGGFDKPHSYLIHAVHRILTDSGLSKKKIDNLYAGMVEILTEPGHPWLDAIAREQGFSQEQIGSTASGRRTLVESVARSGSYTEKPFLKRLVGTLSSFCRGLR